MEGIAKAKANHVYKGRKASIDGQELRRLVTQIAARLKIARQSVYRVLKGAVAWRPCPFAIVPSSVAEGQESAGNGATAPA
jgi:hypothetical protein